MEVVPLRAVEAWQGGWACGGISGVAVVCWTCGGMSAIEAVPRRDVGT